MLKIKDLIDSIVSYLKSIKGEVKRITWPNKQELRAATIVVIITLVIITSILWLFDQLLMWVFRFMKQG